jgi:TolB-like protein/DNA-binding winged helix-turn-helix (wHTH) protein/Tfp pilus assembly protein PilF
MPAEVQAGKPRIDLSRYELSLDGRRVKLERQPMELLIFFAQRRGHLVTREDIVARLWGKDTFVDVDGSINSAVRKIRSALKDDPASPKCLETVVGKGYRLIGEVELVGAPSEVALSSAQDVLEPAAPQSNRTLRRALTFGAVLVLLLAAASWWRLRGNQEPGIAAVQMHSIAVLPLTNLSGDASQDYFADGMTDELTTDLAKISSLRVISRTSTMPYGGSRKSLPQIARELNVDAIVEGSVSRSGNTVRITAQLIDAKTDRHLWAESYARDLGDILAVQNTLALEIARQVRTRLSTTEQQRLGRQAPVNPDAYDAYLRGRYTQMTQSPEGLKEGLPIFLQAIALDPTFAPAYAGLADTYSLLANYRVLSPSAAFPQAEAAARKAVELDANSTEAHTALGYPEHHYTWQWAAAEHEYRTAISLSPSYPTAHLRYAEYLSSVGRHDQAITETRRALELDPLSLVYHSNLGRFLYHARRYDEAIEVLRKNLELDPSRVYSRICLAMCYEEKGMYAQAGEEFERTRTAFGGRPTIASAHLLARSGQIQKARALANTFRQHAEDSDWFLLAGLYAAVGDKDEAFACLQQAYDRHDFFLVFLKVHPYMDPLRSDARFARLIRDIGLPE